MNSETYLSIKIARYTTTHIVVDGNTYGNTYGNTHVSNDINDTCPSVLEKFFFDPGTSIFLCSVCSALTICLLKPMTLLTEFEKFIYIFMKLFNLKYISYIFFFFVLPASILLFWSM